jgi:molecular chaperone HscC
MIVGIDLGTTNSLIGHFTSAGPQLIPNALGEYLTPSIVSVDHKNQVFVGAAARERLGLDANNTAFAFKRSMGTAREIFLSGRSFRPEELSSFVLRSLIEDAEAALKEKSLKRSSACLRIFRTPSAKRRASLAKWPA